MQKVDIVPELQAKIDKTFKGLTESDESLSSLVDKIEDSGTWDDAQAYAGKIGAHRSASFIENIHADDLPNGQMYYNIANRIIPYALEQDYELVTQLCMKVQTQANEAAELGIEAQKPDLNQDRIDGLVDRISSEPFDQVSWLLKAPVENLIRSIVDDAVRANADFHYNSGLHPVIRRTTDGHCCKWCSARAGTYSYRPDMNREVFRRHENCGCTVGYYPDANSKRNQNVWDKTWNKDYKKAPASFLDNQKSQKYPLDIQFFAGKERAEKWSDNWSDAVLEDVIERLVPNAYTTETKQKIEYRSEGSPFVVVVDKEGGYLRVLDSRLPGRSDGSKYVDINGKDVHNILENGKIRGRSKSEWQAATHFRIKRRGDKK